MMNKIFLIVLAALLIVCGCSIIQNSPVYSTDYREGIVNIESSNIILNIYENEKYLQYKLIFDGRELVKKFVKEISQEEYDYSHEKWNQQLTKNILFMGNPYSKEPPKEYIKISTKKFGDIEISHFDKAEIKYPGEITEYHICISKMEIKTRNKSKNIIIKESNIFDFTVIKTKANNYLLILQGDAGVHSFSSRIDIYKL